MRNTRIKYESDFLRHRCRLSYQGFYNDEVIQIHQEAAWSRYVCKLTLTARYFALVHFPALAYFNLKAFFRQSAYTKRGAGKSHRPTMQEGQKQGGASNREFLHKVNNMFPLHDLEKNIIDAIRGRIVGSDF